MKTKNMIRRSLLAVSALAVLASCNKTQPTTADKQSDKAAEAGEATTGLKIAYVEVDSLMSQYNFCKDYTKVMEKKSANARATLANKAKALQDQAAQFQSKAQANAYTQEQGERIQANLMKQQQDLQALQERLSNEFDMEQEKYNKEMRDSIQSFLKQYNKDKKFDYIMSKAGDNLLLANPKYNITKDVVAGLNKRYKAKPEVEKAVSDSDKKKK